MDTLQANLHPVGGTTHPATLPTASAAPISATEAAPGPQVPLPERFSGDYSKLRAFGNLELLL